MVLGWGACLFPFQETVPVKTAPAQRAGSINLFIPMRRKSPTFPGPKSRDAARGLTIAKPLQDQHLGRGGEGVPTWLSDHLPKAQPHSIKKTDGKTPSLHTALPGPRGPLHYLVLGTIDCRRILVGGAASPCHRATGKPRIEGTCQVTERDISMIPTILICPTPPSHLIFFGVT